MSSTEICVNCGHPKWVHSRKLARDDRSRCEALEDMGDGKTFQYCKCKKFIPLPSSQTRT
jgi:hypothetical protein